MSRIVSSAFFFGKAGASLAVAGTLTPHRGQRMVRPAIAGSSLNAIELLHSGQVMLGMESTPRAGEWYHARMRDAIVEKSRALGFERTGFARVEPAPRAEFLPEWLSREYHGEMAYMARSPEVRADPARLVPGARTVVVVAKNYYTDAKQPSDPRFGVVSRYAWGEDYHRVLGRMLERLLPDLERLHPGERFKACCDTAPVLEKAWAERAGIGWIGKNGCLISQEFGSWIFLAIVLTTATLEADAPHPDRCGTCDKCLHSCPTDAFVKPRIVDARRCIPYLTIEQWKPVPRPLKIAPWAFGCDLCQEVCPWNRRAKDSRRAAFAPRDGQRNPDLRAWVAMSGPEFRARFGDTALARPGRRGLARNALAVLREQGLDEETLARARNDASKLVRDQASAADG